jgi:hypothetical protein
MHDNSATVATLDVCGQHESSVTLCAFDGCTNPARPNGKFCSNACRQKAYRKSPAAKAQLDLRGAARFKRRRRHQAMKVAYKTFVPQTGRYSGPDNGLALRRLPEDLTPYLNGDLKVTAEDIQAATQRRLERENKGAAGFTSIAKGVTEAHGPSDYDTVTAAAQGTHAAQGNRQRQQLRTAR